MMQDGPAGAGNDHIRCRKRPHPVLLPTGDTSGRVEYVKPSLRRDEFWASALPVFLR